MVSIPTISSSLLLLAFLFLSVDGRSTSPWKRRFPSLAATTPSTGISHHDYSRLVLPQIRGGDSSSDVPASRFSATTPSSALSTPASKRIFETTPGGGAGAKSNAIATADREEPDATIPCITGGHILRAGRLKPEPNQQSAKGGNNTDVVVESFVTKEDKATKKILKRHKQIAKKLRNRNSVNKRRKIFHFLWGISLASLNHILPRRLFLSLLSLATGTCLSMELFRYKKGYEWINDLLHNILGKTLRKNEMDGKFTGSFYFLSGSLITSYLFPNPCATLGICQLAIADPTASYFGRATRHIYWSRIGNGVFGIGRNKGILGFVGGAICCVPLNYRLLSLALARKSAGVAAQTIAKPTVLAISLALGMAGALIDLMVPTPALTLPKKIFGVRVPPFHLDDNIAIPIMSGWACGQILKVAGFPIPPAELKLAKYLVV